MSAWIDAFLPTFGLIAIGFVLRRTVLTDAVVWAGLDNLTYSLLLPALFASSIATLHLSELPFGGMAGVTWATVLAATAASILIAKAFGHGPAATTSIVQGGIRFNNYIAFAISVGLEGQAGLAFAGVSAGLIVPFVQTVLSVVFAVAEGRRLSPARLARQILMNPLILGCAVGYLFAALGGMPPGIGPLAKALGGASLALGLLCVGAGLVPGDLRLALPTQVATGILKLALVPAMTFLLGRAVGLDNTALIVLTLAMATPTASSSYVMARAMGGDARMMAAIITVQHIASVASLPLWAMAIVP